MKRLYKSKYDIKIDGVCSGVANYFNVDPTLVRLILIIISAVGFLPATIIGYIVAMVIIPRETDFIEQ